MGAYYREPQRSNGPIPFHLVKNLVKSFSRDHYVADTGDVVRARGAAAALAAPSASKRAWGARSLAYCVCMRGGEKPC